MIGKRLTSAAAFPGSETKAGRALEARKGVGRAPGVGDGSAGAKADAGELLDQGREHGGLAAMQMIGAGGVDDDPIRRIGGDDRREPLQHPKRQPLQRFGVGGRIGVLDHQRPAPAPGPWWRACRRAGRRPGRRRPPPAPPAAFRPGPPG